MLIGAPHSTTLAGDGVDVNAVKLPDERRQRVAVLPRELKSV